MHSYPLLIRTIACLVMLAAAGCASAPTPAPTPTQPKTTPIPAAEGWKLAWHDEFDGGAIDPASWTYDLGAGGWGNAELENYTNRPENARLENGVLVIEARKEAYQGAEYTSARLKTQGLREFLYGRIEARLQVPGGQGMWPAFWTLGSNINEKNWPKCGELDIMEYIGKTPDTIYGTMHGPGYSGAQGISKANRQKYNIADDFHIYAIEWDKDQVRWFFDGEPYHTVTRADVGNKDWVFDQPFFILLNLAVGGQWPGNPDAQTAFPAQLKVDYVRVFQKIGK
jgi:beta-glucanase (GH16 family)